MALSHSMPRVTSQRASVTPAGRGRTHGRGLVVCCHVYELAQLEFPSCCLCPQGCMWHLGKLINSLVLNSAARKNKGRVARQTEGGSRVSWERWVVFRVRNINSLFHLPTGSKNTVCGAVYMEQRSDFCSRGWFCTVLASWRAQIVRRESHHTSHKMPS